MTDKYGFGQALANPSDATVDIVFVHGLGGDRKKTWTADKTKHIPRETFWPQDLLPKACPTARILSFGYNSSFVSFFPLVGSKAPVAKETTVDDYSSNLLHELSTFRNREENPTPDDRPIIFVAHSLGGLVVANAVARQHGIDSEAKKLSDNTVGMLFLGTPFEGSKKAEWGKLGDRFKRIIPGIKTEDIKNLEERSAKLESINIALNKYVKERDRDRTRRPLNIVCYFEEHPTYEAGLDIGKIVTKPSATTIPAIPALSVDADHQDMCKFAGEFLRGYQSVSGQLVQWVKDLKKKLPADTDAANVPANNYSIGEVNDNEGVVAVNIEAPKDGGYLEITGKKVGGTNFFGNAPIDDVVKLVEAMGRTKKERKQTDEDSQG